MISMISWTSLLGLLLILVGLLLGLFSLFYAAFTIRSLKPNSGLTNWGEINVVGLFIGFSIPFGTAIALQGGKFLGYDLEHFLIPVLRLFIPLLALTVISSLIRLLYSGISRRPREAAPNEKRDSNPERSESK